jgi:hypothetical protein
LEARRDSPELAHNLADLARYLGEFGRAKHHESDEKDDEEFATPNVEHLLRLLLLKTGESASVLKVCSDAG